MLQEVLTELRRAQAQLVAVSKKKSNASILELYAQGQRIFGENYVQELVEKHQSLPQDIQWHFIGHLQTNKVKFIASFVTMIHSVDSVKMLQEVDRQASKYKRVIDVLLQFHIADEATKFGLDKETAIEFLSNPVLQMLHNVRICGVMGMATFTDDKMQVRQEFRQLKNGFDFIKNQYFKDVDCFNTISMGMSDDYSIALEEGSTMVRIGSLLFGKRV
jgi:pyridoxal phosphate enzyme (YggS family)